ncbi:ligand-binding protein SH3 [Thermoplasmatales archaeon SW_10_69_26]|nr:MAG: ligand-binding protein SH3 [Thermoplasmatales archaeon SW_10_69_26]
MAWARLIVAGLFEVGWAVGLKYSEGFSRLVSSIATLAALAVSMVLLAQAVERIPLGTAYAVWTGIGAVGTALVGIVLFDEPPGLARLGFIATILVGIVGLHLTGS